MPFDGWLISALSHAGAFLLSDLACLQAYRESWTSIATTMGTEATVPVTLDQLKEATNYTEPFNLLQLPGQVVGLRQF